MKICGEIADANFFVAEKFFFERKNFFKSFPVKRIQFSEIVRTEIFRVARRKNRVGNFYTFLFQIVLKFCGTTKIFNRLFRFADDAVRRSQNAECRRRRFFVAGFFGKFDTFFDRFNFVQIFFLRPVNVRLKQKIFRPIRCNFFQLRRNFQSPFKISRLELRESRRINFQDICRHFQSPEKFFPKNYIANRKKKPLRFFRNDL